MYKQYLIWVIVSNDSAFWRVEEHSQYDSTGAWFNKVPTVEGAVAFVSCLSSLVLLPVLNYSQIDTEDVTLCASLSQWAHSDKHQYYGQ